MTVGWWWSRADLDSRLREVDSEIAGHPFSSEAVKAAHSVIDSVSDGDKEAITRELSARGLPTLEELGKMQVKHGYAWWKLHRRRRRLLAKIERIG